MTVVIKRKRLCYTCPGCKKALRSHVADAGKLDHCSHCHHVFTVPELGTPLELAGDSPAVEVPKPQVKPRVASSDKSFGDLLEAMLWRHWVLVVGLILWSPMYFPNPFASEGNSGRDWQSLQPESNPVAAQSQRQPVGASFAGPLSQMKVRNRPQPASRPKVRATKEANLQKRVRAIEPPASVKTIAELPLQPKPNAAAHSTLQTKRNFAADSTSQRRLMATAGEKGDSTSRFLHSVSDWDSVRRIFREVHNGYWYDIIYDSSMDRFLRVRCEITEEVDGTIDLTAFYSPS